MRKSALAAVLLGAMAAAAPAMAAQIFSTSYSTPNGDGQASGGSFNYWDLSYSGLGSTNVDGAALSGGSGDLTDGAAAGDFWFNTETIAGTGPYVGWYAPHTPNPTVTFNFAGGQTITQIGIHLDNSWAGGVYAPAAILVDGVAQAFTPVAIGSIGWSYITGLNLTGASHTVQFQQAQGGWTFVSEVTFDGSTGGVPEPSTWALLLLGFGGLGATLRLRRDRAEALVPA